jgi:predicted chitinase
MATPSPQTKITAVSKSPMNMGKVLTASTVTSNGGDSLKILGEIFKIMRIMDEDRKLNQEMVNSHLEEEEHKKEKRNQEIIKALTGRKKPKVKKPKVKKQEEPTKPSEKQPEVKQPEAPRPEAPKVEAPKPSPKPEAPKAPEAPKPVPKAEAPKPPTPTTKAPIIPGAAGTKSLVIAALLAAGISSKAQANILANVEEESGFKPRSEDLARYSGKTLFRLYGPRGVEGGQPTNGGNKVRFNTIEDANQLVAKGPEAVGDVIYGGRMGNNSPGDGFKYRGRGFIQITGKDMYKQIGAAIGEDLVANPDLANDPKIAAKIVPAFFKLKLNNKKPQDLEQIDVVNSMVGSASEESRNKRKKLSESYNNTIGSEIAAVSSQNTDMKKDLNAQSQTSSSTTVVNNTTQSTPSSSGPQVNDMSAAYNKSKETKK